jgi:hypothetical protein
MTVHSIFDYKKILVLCNDEIYEIDRDSIEMYEMSLLNRLIKQPYLNEKHYPLYNDRHVIPLNRDKQMFELILEFYRKAKVYIPFKVPYEQVYDEFDYFGLPVNNTLRSLNINERWKKIPMIVVVENILDLLVRSAWFNERIENHLFFEWEIGPELDKIASSVNYDLFQNKQLHPIISKILERKYNLYVKWGTASFKNTSCSKLIYFNVDNPEGESVEVNNLMTDNIKCVHPILNNFWDDSIKKETSSIISVYVIKFSIKY